MGGKKISSAMVDTVPHQVAVNPAHQGSSSSSCVSGGSSSSNSCGMERLSQGGNSSSAAPSPPAAGAGGASASSSICGYAGVLKKNLPVGGGVGSGNGGTGANGKSKSTASSSSSPVSMEEAVVAEGGEDFVNANGNGTSHDGNKARIETGEDRTLHEALNDLDLQSVEQAGNTHLTQGEDAFAASVEVAVIDTGNDRIKGGTDDLLKSNTGGGSGGDDGATIASYQWKVEYKPPNTGGKNGNGNSNSRSSHQQVHREYEHHRSVPDREFRPPSLILPDAVNIDSVDSDYRAPRTLHLPASLVVSPHGAKQIQLLDPNAREFTPSPSPCHSPVLPHNCMGLVPSPYPHMEPQPFAYAPTVELGPVMYGSDFSGGPVVPLYGNGGPMGYGHLPGSPTPPWENHHMGMGEMAHHHHHHHHLSPGAGPPIVGQTSHMMRPYVPAQSMHGYMPPGCTPQMGSPTGFTVSPPLTGREHVSRALLLTGVPLDLPEHQLRHELDQWGTVRALGLDRRQEGLVTVHYYDLRHAKEALRDVQQQHLLQQQRMQEKFQQMHKQRSGGGSHMHNELELDTKQEGFKEGQRDDAANPPAVPPRGLIGGKAVWAQYTVPVGNAAGPDSHNQGTLVVFNLDADMPPDELRAVFEAHGAVKELRETPSKRQHKFVEFFDVRDAARALTALDGQEIGGKRVKIEFSRPGGQARRARAQAQQAQVMAQQQQHQQGAAMLPIGNNRVGGGGLAGSVPGQHMMFGWGVDPGMGPAQSMSPLQTPPAAYMWANFGPTVPAGPSSMTHMNTIVQQQQWNVGHGQLQQMPYPQIQGPASHESGVSIAHEGAHGRHYGRNGRGFSSGALCSPGGSSFHSGIHASFSRACHGGGPTNRGGCDEPTGRRRRGSNGGGVGGGCGNSISNGSLPKMDVSSLPSSSSSSDTKQNSEMSSGGSRDSPRSGKTGLTPKSSPREHAQYAFNADPAEQNLDTPRTTLMIKNIPNKYNQPMLLTLLDQHCKGCNKKITDPNEPQSAYDFVYLPIDFKNRCNLGYAFVNFTSVPATIRLYEAFHSKQWEAFNSRKICQVTYARVQGRAALEEHFRNSRFACDTDEYLPLVFSPPRTGLVCPAPIVAAGHLAGRSLTCSPRAEICRSSRNGELVGDSSSTSSTSSGSQEPQSLQQQSQEQQRESGLGISDQDNEVGASSSTSTSTSSTGIGAVASSYSGRRPSVQLHRP
ncbi:hypothetical protein R1sor_019768 [Riccia sorocarpa]|uniref:RRM domain-containing protein n=1 Tax=Riccia sorocarpa TaxID=122646 RepID=A0ABD3IEJ4_9MARC